MQALDAAGEGGAAEGVEFAVGHGGASLVGGPGRGRGGVLGARDQPPAGRRARVRARQQPQGGRQLDQGAGPEPVVGPVAVAIGLDQPGLPQDLEVVADQRLRGLQLLGQVGDTQLLGG
jgi:hypothetical protein